MALNSAINYSITNGAAQIRSERQLRTVNYDWRGNATIIDTLARTIYFNYDTNSNLFRLRKADRERQRRITPG